MNTKYIAPILAIVILLISTVACSTSDKTESKSAQKISLAPGTAIVSGQLLSFEEFDRSYTCKFKVIKVNEYGSSVPLLQKDSEIEIKLNKSVLTRASLTANDLKSETDLKLLIKASPSVGSDKTFWQILSIK